MPAYVLIALLSINCQSELSVPTNRQRQYNQSSNVVTTLQLLMLLLKLQSCKLYSNKYKIGSTQITKTKIFTFIAVQIFKLFSRTVLFINSKDNRNCQVGYFLKNLTGKLQQNYNEFEYKIFRVLLKHVSDNLSVLFEFA